ERRENLLVARLRPLTRGGLRHAEEAIAGAHLKARPLDPHFDRMIALIELLIFRVVAEQIITLTIAQHLLDAEIKVVIVEHGKPTRLTRNEGQAVLRVEVVL